MKVFLTFFLFVSLAFQANAQESKHEVLDKATFKSSIENNTVALVDVRTASEFEAGHIDNAKNIDFLDTATFNSKLQTLDKSKPVYIYCRSGNRSSKAAEVMKDSGFTTIYELEGGYFNWNSEDPTED